MATKKGNYLPVEIGDGMFSNECAVKINVQGNFIGTLFVNKSLIESHKNKNYLRLDSVYKSGDKKFTDILLPTEIMENGSRWVKIPNEQLVHDDFK